MAKKSAVKDRILEVASRLFYQQGYNLTGINQIIKEADIAIGSLYNHFPSKKDVLIAYLQNEDKKWFEEFEEFSKSNKNPKARLLMLFDYRIYLQVKSDFSGCNFIKINAELADQEKDITKIVERHKEKQKQLVTELVLQIDTPSLLSKEQLIGSIFLLLEGGATTTAIYRDVTPLKESKSIIEALL